MLIAGGVLAAVFAPAASALTLSGGLSLGGITGVTGAPGTSAPSLSAVFNSPNEGNILASVGCPIAQSLPSPPVPNQIPSVICALNVLNYAYRTVYVQPGGTKLTRITRALVGVPTPIDVNGDGLPDFVGTLFPTLSGTGLGLDITRGIGFPATAQVSIEAIALDPAASQSYIGAGEDGLSAGTDGDWSATVTFAAASTAGTEVSINQKNSSAPSTIGTLGEFFTGSNPDAPTNISRGDASFTPAPATLTTDVKLSQASQEAIVTSSASSLVQAAVSLISPGDDKEIAATVNKLATSVDVNYTHPNSDTNVAYTADAPVGQLSARYHDTVNGSLATAAALDATSVPTGVTVDQTGSQTTVTTAGGAVGLIEARYGSGMDVPALASGTGAYAAYHAYANNSLTAGVRLPGLKALTLNAAQPFSGELTLSQPLDYVALSAQDDSKGYAVAGHLKSLPKHSKVGIGYTTSVAPVTEAKETMGTVSFNGDNDGVPAGIGEIAADITNTQHPQQPFFGRATDINATIDGIPSSDTITVDYRDSGILVSAPTKASATATAPIGSIQVLAGDGSSAAASAPSTDVGSGVWYSDTQSAYFAFARIAELTGYNVSLTKDSSDSITSLSGGISTGGQDVASCTDTTTAGQSVTVHAQTDGGTFDSTLNQLPTSVSFSMAPDANGNSVVDYSASAPIKKITADASGFASLAALGAGGDIAPTMDRFHGEIDCLPKHVTLDMDKSGETSLNTYGDHIGEVMAQVFNHQVGPAGPGDVGYPDTGNGISSAPAGDQLAYYDPAAKGISVDLKRVGGFDFLDNDTTGILTLQHDIDAGTPLAFHYISQSLKTPLGLSGTLDHPQPGTLTVNHNTDGTLNMQFRADSRSSNLSGDGSIGTIAFDGYVKSNYLQGTLGNLPANLAVCLDYSTGVEVCGPPWVFQDSLDLHTDNSPQLFAIHVVPTDLNGNIPSTPLTLFGEFCFGSSRKSDCDKTGSGQGGGPAGVFMPSSNPLSFDALWLGLSQHTDDCHLSFTCGRAWAGLDTTDRGNDPNGKLTGQARYYQSNDKDYTIRFNTNTGGYVNTNQLYVWADYNIGANFGFDEVTAGHISCGSGGQQSLLLNEGPGINLLTNSLLGLCP